MIRSSVVRMGPGRSRLRYKIHRAVDEQCEVITATDVSAGEINEAHLLTPLIDQHQTNTGKGLQQLLTRGSMYTVQTRPNSQTPRTAR